MRGEVAEERLDRQVLGEAQGLAQPIAPAPVLPYYGGAVPPAGTALPSLPAQPSTVVPHQPTHVLSAQPQIGQLSQTASLNGHPDELAILQGIWMLFCLVNVMFFSKKILYAGLQY